MPIIQSFLAEFKQEAATTRRLLERIPEDKLTWKPHEKSMTLHQLTNHIAQTPNWITVLAGQDEFDVGSPGPAHDPGETRGEILAAFDRGVATFKSVAAGISDEAMGAGWKVRNGEKVLMNLSRAVAIRAFILNHVVHHRGQLSVYLRLLDTPVPAIYGPSADENIFA